MTHDDAILHHTLLIESRPGFLISFTCCPRFYLTGHLRQCRLRYLRVVGCMGIACRYILFHIFEICQINVHNTFQHSKCFYLFITAAIVNDGNRKPATFRLPNRPYDFRCIMCGRHQIDICRSLVLKLQENISQPFPRNFFSCFRSCNMIILTVYAPQRTAAEKYCSGTGFSGNTGFLPHMKRCSCSRNSRPRYSADSGLSRFSVNTTISGAKSASSHLFSSLPNKMSIVRGPEGFSCPSKIKSAAEIFYNAFSVDSVF